MTNLSKLLVASLIFISLGLTGCTSTFQNAVERSSLNYSNQPAQIKCYSGGQLIYQGTSIGKVTDDEDSDGFFWRDKDGFVETNSDCMFTYSNPSTKYRQQQ